MTLITSHRPLSESPEIARNQIRAKESWELVFDEIIYFGKQEPSLSSNKTMFIDSDEFPTIDLLLTAAALASDWSCLINADIVVSPLLGKVLEECIQKRVQAFTSMRYEFDPDAKDMSQAKVKDSGYDFFMTDAALWTGAAQKIPPGYRIGHNRWDNWILGYFNTVCRRRFVDITSRRVIFHPRHENRKQPHHIDVPQDQYLDVGRPPFYRLP
jgi:hypothetical protein